MLICSEGCLCFGRSLLSFATELADFLEELEPQELQELTEEHWKYFWDAGNYGGLALRALWMCTGQLQLQRTDITDRFQADTGTHNLVLRGDSNDIVEIVEVSGFGTATQVCVSYESPDAAPGEAKETARILRPAGETIECHLGVTAGRVSVTLDTAADMRVRLLAPAALAADDVLDLWAGQRHWVQWTLLALRRLLPAAAAALVFRFCRPDLVRRDVALGLWHDQVSWDTVGWTYEERLWEEAMEAAGDESLMAVLERLRAFGCPFRTPPHCGL